MTLMKNLSLACIAVTALLAAGCGGADGADNDVAAASAESVRKTRVESLLLKPGVFKDVIELTGTVEAINDATLSAQSAGTVEMLAPLGRHVERGAIIAQLDQDLVSATYAQAEASLENALAGLELAEDNYRRQEPLFRDSIISALEFQGARTQRQQARAMAREAEARKLQVEKQRDNTVIRAPFLGTVEAHMVEQGEQVSPGMPILRIVNAREVKVRVGVPEVYSGDIQIGTEAMFGFTAYRGAQKSGKVIFAGSAIHPDSRTFMVEARVDNNDGQLKPAMIAQVFVTREQLDSALVVPRSAVVRNEDGNSVFVIREEDDFLRARPRIVTLGAAYEGQVLVEAGLEPDMEIVVLGQNTITDGDVVEVVERYSGLDIQGVPIK